MLPVVERVTIRTVSVIRAVIVTSLLGHWAANALFDRDQYAGAGSELLTRLDDPFLVQAALGLLVVVALTIRDRRQVDRSCLSLGRLPLTVLLVGLQLLVFVGLESSERLVIDVFAGGTADVGVFGVGFLAELAVAVGSAVILGVIAEATKRLFQLLRPGELRSDERHTSPILLGFTRPLQALSGAGGVRAPPS
jgi:hypothetical protein